MRVQHPQQGFAVLHPYSQFQDVTLHGLDACIAHQVELVHPRKLVGRQGFFQLFEGEIGNEPPLSRKNLLLDKAAVADEVFQPTDEHQLKKHDRVPGGLTSVAIQRLRLLIEEVPVDQLG
jgi:hypothetical protein